MNDSVVAQLAALKTAPIGALKQKWRDLFDREPPPYNRRFLESRLAYRIPRKTPSVHSNTGFKHGQAFTASMVALAHGTSDGQKTMG